MQVASGDLVDGSSGASRREKTYSIGSKDWLTHRLYFPSTSCRDNRVFFGCCMTEATVGACRHLSVIAGGQNEKIIT